MNGRRGFEEAKTIERSDAAPGLSAYVEAVQHCICGFQLYVGNENTNDELSCAVEATATKGVVAAMNVLVEYSGSTGQVRAKSLAACCCCEIKHNETGPTVENKTGATVVTLSEISHKAFLKLVASAIVSAAN